MVEGRGGRGERGVKEWRDDVGTCFGAHWLDKM
jgi:hypothetical protein